MQHPAIDLGGRESQICLNRRASESPTCGINLSSAGDAGAVGAHWFAGVAAGIAHARQCPMTISAIDLAHVQGAMDTTGFRPSRNVEDRRDWSREDSLNAPTLPAEPLPPLIRHPGDLSSQAGLDDIGKLH